jgi:hypothetical protein
LLVGVREPDAVAGTDVRLLGHLVDQLGGRIRPLPETILHAVEFQGKQIGVVVFRPVHNEIAISDAGAFVRRGEAIRVMEAEEIRQKLPPEETPEQAQVTHEHLAKGIEALSNSLSKMRDELQCQSALKTGSPALLMKGHGARGCRHVTRHETDLIHGNMIAPQDSTGWQQGSNLHCMPLPNYWVMATVNG